MKFIQVPKNSFLEDKLLIEEGECIKDIVRKIRKIKNENHISQNTYIDVEFLKNEYPVPEWYYEIISKLAKIHVVLVDKLSEDAVKLESECIVKIR